MDTPDSVAARSAMYALGLHKGRIAAPSTSHCPCMGWSNEEQSPRNMRMRGLEPPRPYGHGDLNAARLPIPPHPRDAAATISHRDRAQECPTTPVPRLALLASTEQN